MAWLPADPMFQCVVRDDSICDYDQYVNSLIGDLQFAKSVAQNNSDHKQKHQSSQNNKRAKDLALAISDQVLVANKSYRGKRKLADK